MTGHEREVGRVDDRHDRGTRTEAPERGEGTGGKPAPVPPPPEWLRPSDGPPSDRTSPEVETATRHLSALIAELAEGAENDVHGRAERLVRAFDSDVLSRAVTTVHRRLDAAVGSALSREEATEIRGGLNRITEALWAADVGSETGIWQEVLKEVSHDLRSPLNSILFLVDGLYGERSGPLTDAQRRQLGVVYSAAATLLNIVNDIMDFARLSSEGSGEAEASEVPFSMSGVLANVRRLVGPIAEHRGCRLRTELEVQGARLGDPHIVSRVLVNLVSNAIDAVGEDGEVVVRAAADGETLRIEVMDDGDEADPDRLQELAAPDSDAGLTRTLCGEIHGLGLVISGRMVRAAGGSMTVSRTPDGWTRFDVELPFERA